MNANAHRLLPVLGLALLVGCARPAADVETYREQLTEHHLRIHWDAQLPLALDEEVLEYHLLGENVYCITSHSTVFALHADAGVIAWSRQLESPGATIYKPTISLGSGRDDAVTITSQSAILVVDRHSGETLSAVQLAKAPATPAVASDELAWYANYEHTLRARHLSLDFAYWELHTETVCRAAPILFPDMLIACTMDGTVYAMTPVTKELLWEFRARGPIAATPAVAGDTLIVASEDRRVYAVDLDTGMLLWQHLSPEPLRDDPIVVRDTVYQLCGDGGMLALDVTNGAARWFDPAVTRFLARHGDVVYAVDLMNDIVALDDRTGGRRWALRGQGMDMAAANDRDAAIYLGTYDGQVRCLRRTDVPYLRRGNVEAALRSRTTSDLVVSDAELNEMRGDLEPRSQGPADPLEDTSSVPPVTLRGGPGG